MIDKHIILGVHITDRTKRAVEVQRVLTAHGDVIKTRLGLHEIERSQSSPNGLVLLELCCDEARGGKLVEALRAVEGVDVQQMVFDHP